MGKEIMPDKRLHILLSSVQRDGKGEISIDGNSMAPDLPSGTRVVIQSARAYEVGDVVFCRVDGRLIDAHRIVDKRDDEYLIANASGKENGWTKDVFGRVTSIKLRDMKMDEGKESPAPHGKDMSR